MESQFSFLNLLGKSYTAGNIVFAKTGDKQREILLSPVNNRVNSFDFTNNTVRTTEFGHTYNIDTIAISPDSKLLVTASQDGETTFMSYPQGVVLRKHVFPARIDGMYFSEDGKFLAVTGTRLSIYQVDHNVSNTLASTPVLVDSIVEIKHFTTVDWIGSEYIAVGTNSGIVHLYKVSHVDNTYRLTDHCTLAGFRDEIVCCQFAVDELGKKNPGELYAVDSSGKVMHWKFDVNASNWAVANTGISKRCVCATIHFEKRVIALGVNGGYIFLKLDDFSQLQELSVTKNANVTSIIFNESGDWIALAVKAMGQLLVWDWNSQTYVIKQQSHGANVSKITFSPFGDMIAAGDHDGKVKVFDCKTGQSFVTLDKHTGPITGIVFSRPPGSRDPAIFTSSKDGTCRAFDMLRYKNFRTYTPSHATSLNCIAVDPSGEILVAGGLEEFDLFIWNIQTKQLLDTIKAHTAPISALVFSAERSLLVSSSWDKTIKIWDIFGRKATGDTLIHSTEVVAIAVRPDGTEICASTIDGTLSFWDINSSQLSGFIECKRDISVGQGLEDPSRMKIEAKKFFSSVLYTADGTCVIAGGKSQFLNMYSVKQKVLLKRFILSVNLSISGVQSLERFFVPYHLLLKAHTRKKENERSSKIEKIIGAQDVPGSKAELVPEISCDDMAFSSTNREFAIATPEGILVYSTDASMNFQPLDIDPSITSSSIMDQLSQGNFGEALIMSIRLNEPELLSLVFNSIPVDSISLISRSIPKNYLERFLVFLSQEVEKHPHLQFNLQWITSALQAHGEYILQENLIASTMNFTRSSSASKLSAALRSVLRAVHARNETLNKIANENQYSLDYVLSFARPEALVDVHARDEERKKGEENAKKEKAKERNEKKKKKKAAKKLEGKKDVENHQGNKNVESYEGDKDVESYEGNKDVESHQGNKNVELREGKKRRKMGTVEEESASQAQVMGEEKHKKRKVTVKSQ